MTTAERITYLRRLVALQDRRIPLDTIKANWVTSARKDAEEIIAGYHSYTEVYRREMSKLEIGDKNPDAPIYGRGEEIFCAWRDSLNEALRKKGWFSHNEILTPMREFGAAPEILYSF